MRGNEASAKDLPDFTKAVASNLVCWSDKTHNLAVYGIGGTGVLADTALRAIVDQAVTGANCTVGKESKIATTAAKLTLDTGDPDITAGTTDTAKIKIDNYDSDVTYTVTVSPASLKSATTGHTNEGLTFTVARNNDEITVTAAEGTGTPAAPTNGAVIKGNITVTVVASKAGTISGTTTQKVKVDVTK